METRKRRPAEGGEIETKTSTPSNTVVASDWQPYDKGTLKGFLCLLLPSGLSIRDCTLHQKNAARWVGLPGRPRLDRDGNPIRDLATGRVVYSPTVEFRDWETRQRFQEAALAAVDRLIGETVP